MEEEKVKIVRVDDAAFFIADLFGSSFGDPPPTLPIHYVAFYQTAPTTFEPIGYYHTDHRGEYALMGGLCVDPRYRNRGLGERLARIAFADAGEAKAFFTYVGNPVSINIVRRIGYVETRQKHMMVKWLKSLSEEEKKQMITEVIALGPF